MKCSKHTDRDAVAQCANCGAGVCSECLAATESIREHSGVLCVNCYSSELQSAAEFYRSRMRKRIIRVVVSAVLYIIGAVLLGIGAAANSIPLMILGVLLTGIFTGIMMFKKGKEEHEKHERKHGVSYTVTDTGVYRDNGFVTKICYFAVGTIFGIIATPIKIIVDSLGAAEDKRTAKDLMEEAIEVRNI